MHSESNLKQIHVSLYFSDRVHNVFVIDVRGKPEYLY
jgi:hypothetical protein